jgi:type III restriction enzyme
LAPCRRKRKLEAEALKDEADGHGYVRPIVLFQAQNAGDEMPPEALRRYLIDELQSACQPDRGGHRHHARAGRPGPGGAHCPVRYVITVQALREGWDCPFAYVLCSLQKLTSATAVEQLLGRVLRMPYARGAGARRSTAPMPMCARRSFQRGACAGRPADPAHGV